MQVSLLVPSLLLLIFYLLLLLNLSRLLLATVHNGLTNYNYVAHVPLSPLH